MNVVDQYKPKPLDKESQIALEAIDTNCGTCIHFKRDLEWAKEQRKKYSSRLSHSKGVCMILEKIIGGSTGERIVSNGICIPENQKCWKSRRLNNTEGQ